MGWFNHQPDQDFHDAVGVTKMGLSDLLYLFMGVIPIGMVVGWDPCTRLDFLFFLKFRSKYVAVKMRRSKN